MAEEKGLTRCINRIRLEFKGIRDRYAAGVVPVLIESDWNLKICTSVFMFLSYPVLIESDWNLKHAMMDIDIAAISINRIRLEFKGRRECQDLSNKYGINRIRLEFEVHPKIKSFVEKYLY